MSNEDQETTMIQKLMSAEEVYLYKIPPMKDSGGHRAEDWDLGKPLKTCSLLVERRGDALCLDFLHEGKLFAQSKMDLLHEDFKLNHWLEQVVDSSRYFSLKIQGAGGREATIGFGFRDRDQATDLRESLQHYEKSLSREKNAKSLAGSFSIPKMEDGEKIHVNRAGKSTITTKCKEAGGRSGAVPLLKKPPPPAEDSVQNKEVEKMSINMDNVDLNSSPKNEDDDDSEGAVFTGDKEQWSTEFSMK